MRTTFFFGQRNKKRMAAPAFAPPAPPCTLRWEAYPPLSDEPDGDAVAALAATVADVVASTVADAGFLWHADPLTPRASTVVAPPWWPQARRAGVGAPSPPPPPCVWGETSFGDAVSDEWFVAALLVDVTRTVPGCVVRLWDDDGEFFCVGEVGCVGAGEKQRRPKQTTLTTTTHTRRLPAHRGRPRPAPLAAPRHRPPPRVAGRGAGPHRASRGWIPSRTPHTHHRPGRVAGSRCRL